MTKQLDTTISVKNFLVDIILPSPSNSLAIETLFFFIVWSFFIFIDYIEKNVISRKIFTIIIYYILYFIYARIITTIFINIYFDYFINFFTKVSL